MESLGFNRGLGPEYLLDDKKVMNMLREKKDIALKQQKIAREKGLGDWSANLCGRCLQAKGYCGAAKWIDCGGPCGFCKVDHHYKEVRHLRTPSFASVDTF